MSDNIWWCNILLLYVVKIEIQSTFIAGERPAAMYSHSTRDRRPTHLVLLLITAVIYQLARRRPL